MTNTPKTNRLQEFSQVPPEELCRSFGLTEAGLTDAEVKKMRLLYGSNLFGNLPGEKIPTCLRRAFINPFSLILFLLAFISFLLNIYAPGDPSHPGSSVIIITVMLFFSGTIRFFQEYKANKTATALTKPDRCAVNVKRNRHWIMLDSEELVCGDYIRLSSGENVPADLRLTKVSDCFISEAVLTGENAFSEKNTKALNTPPLRISDYTNCAFYGTTLMNGTCEGMVTAVGSHTCYGTISLKPRPQKNTFERGSNSIAWVLIRFMIILVPLVFVVSGITKGDWLDALLFSLSVAVGLTPELLPMVVTACLARGTFAMGKKETVVKNINAMQTLGNMDMLCVDKTGTLTDNTLTLEYYTDILGNENGEVLDAAYLNSFFHAGVRNHLDRTILKSVEMPHHELHFQNLSLNFQKVDEIPFDYERKRSSVLLKQEDSHILLMKGTVDAVAERCSQVWFRGALHPIGENKKESVHAVVDEILEEGMKVLAVAAKKTDTDTISPKQEENMILLGYLIFFDAPKRSAAEALIALKEQNIRVKVLSGDHASVTKSICTRLGISVQNLMTGADFDKLGDNDAQIRVEETDVFSELSPSQKESIVRLLQSNGHTVGFLADGLNDLPALLASDVGISVENGARSVKESAQVILGKKDLHVLEEGILEGRRAFVNMTKYMKITASSNFGNIISIVFASILLPFFPMTSIQLLLLNLLYDTLCLALPWDRVDSELTRRPLLWDGKNLARFMLFFGPLSSIFDLLTFAFLFFVLCPDILGGSFGSLSVSNQARFVSVFQTAWFVESIWSQTLLLHLLRSEKMPLTESRPAPGVLGVTVFGISLFTVLATGFIGKWIGMSSLPPLFFLYLAVSVFLYLLSVTLFKRIYIRRYGNLL